MRSPRRHRQAAGSATGAAPAGGARALVGRPLVFRPGALGAALTAVIGASMLGVGVWIASGGLAQVTPMIPAGALKLPGALLCLVGAAAVTRGTLLLIPDLIFVRLDIGGVTVKTLLEGDRYFPWQEVRDLRLDRSLSVAFNPLLMIPLPSVRAQVQFQALPALSHTMLAAEGRLGGGETLVRLPRSLSVAPRTLHEALRAWMARARDAGFPTLPGPERDWDGEAKRRHGRWLLYSGDFTRAAALGHKGAGPRRPVRERHVESDGRRIYLKSDP